MFNLDTITSKNGNKKWPYRMLIIGPSGSEKTNALLNLIQQDNHNLIDKICLYAKDLNEPKYQCLIEKREDAGIKNLNDPSDFIEYSNTKDDVYDNKCRKLSISLAFITQSYFRAPKEVRLNFAYYLIMKIHNKRELQEITINHSADLTTKTF